MAGNTFNTLYKRRMSEEERAKKEEQRRQAAIEKQKFLNTLREERVPLPRCEYKFCPDRDWRADYCWISHCFILEVEGGIWTGGRHTRPEGYFEDIEKYNTMAILGYRMVRIPAYDLNTRKTIDIILKIIAP